MNSLATQENNLSVVRFLTRHGANVKLKAADGMTSFHVSSNNLSNRSNKIKKITLYCLGSVSKRQS